MMRRQDRRRFLAQATLGALAFSAKTSFGSVGNTITKSQALKSALVQLEHESGGRLGVSFLDLEHGDAIGHREEERFPLCSTFKVLAVASLLKQVDDGRLDLDKKVLIVSEDVLKYAPVTSQHLGGDGLSLSELCNAALILSDNTAANLILRQIGGPRAVTDFARLLGDDTTRLDRNEPTLNEATPGDVRDTTSPLAMARDLKALFFGSALSPSTRSSLKHWMESCQTGAMKIRRGFPSTFTVADKTGSGEHRTSNDVAVIWPTGQRGPFILTVYATQMASESAEKQAEIIAAAARACFQYSLRGQS